jgi:hypothetical protein
MKLSARRRHRSAHSVGLGDVLRTEINANNNSNIIRATRSAVPVLLTPHVKCQTVRGLLKIREMRVSEVSVVQSDLTLQLAGQPGLSFAI